MSCYVGVDVGTSSVRAAIVSERGEILSTAVEEITIWNPRADHYEQSSQNIWAGVSSTVKTALLSSGVSKDNIKGIGFDATCSLVVLDNQFQPITVSETGKSECNVILWMDHRAEKQAAEINQSGSSVLRYVGGTMSLEMQMPKLLWLKQKLLDSCWKKADHLFDLPDFLTWRATGSLSRSLCSLVCKWGYVAGSEGHSGWNNDFLKHISLEDLIGDNNRKIGNDVRAPGENCGKGLTQEAAGELGLNPGTPVGTSMIDAHAGALGCKGCVPRTTDISIPPITDRLVLICGTSNCHMADSETPIFVDGVWGPYYSVVLPGLYANEGGQSAAGKLVGRVKELTASLFQIDFVVETHPAYQETAAEARKSGTHVTEYLNNHLEKIRNNKGRQHLCELTADLHVWPDFHGNRSPVADPSLKGMVCGLTLSSGVDSLALLYLATVQALAYGTRHIVSEMNRSGHNISLVYLCGGLHNNNLFVTTTADVLNMPLVLPDTPVSVLLGAAILGARASGNFTSVQNAMEKMGGTGDVVKPNKDTYDFHNKKYCVFLKMLDHQKEYRQIMSS